MARRRGSGHGEHVNAWPGYVDALSTLLMVIIFVLLVFVLAQAFLSVALTGRDRALDRVNRQMSELTAHLEVANITYTSRVSEKGGTVEKLDAQVLGRFRRRAVHALREGSRGRAP